MQKNTPKQTKNQKNPNPQTKKHHHLNPGVATFFSGFFNYRFMK